MAEVLTTDWKIDTTRLFVADVLASQYYVFASGTVKEDSTNSIRSTTKFLEQVQFGKKINNSDVKFMIKYYPWQLGGVYAKYDDNIDISNSNFYAVVGPTNNSTGDYRVYKCLDNNNGGASISAPIYDASTINQIYDTGDGYIWKFMYAITRIEFESYNALGYIPIMGTFDTDPVANTAGSQLGDIEVTNIDSNNGYTVALGQVKRIQNSNGNIGRFTVEFGVGTTFSKLFAYYVGQTIYTTNSNGGFSYPWTILSYTWDDPNSRGLFVVEGQPADSVQGLGGQGGGTSSFQVFPRIKISGDGSGALAIPIITDGIVTDVTLFEGGQNYNNATAEVVNPVYDFDPDNPATIDVKALLRPILTPVDGHGSNLLNEFYCRHFLLYGYITGANNNEIGYNNVYSKVGVVKDPEWANTVLYNNLTGGPEIFDNRIAITSDDTRDVVRDEILYQYNSSNEIVFQGQVHSTDQTSNTFYLINYSGPQLNIANNDISLDTSLNFRKSTGQNIRINTPVVDNIIESPYVQRTGKVYYMEDFFPLERTVNSREEFKFVMEF